MKNILLIGTGGTIASEDTGAGLKPVLTTAELLGYLPETKRRCNIESVQLMSIDSTNIQPRHWLEITAAIRDNYDRFDGFVVTHGTDTMAYTAAALSYLIQNSPKPVVITGSQKPINSESTDSRVNLADSFTCASDSRMHGVSIVFNGKVIPGTRARKTRSKSYSAFSSINYPYTAVIHDGCLMQYIRQQCKSEPSFYSSLDERVVLFKLTPGVGADVLEYMLEHNDAVIIESYGVGGIPTMPDGRFYEVIGNAVNGHGKTVVITTQVPNEGSDIAVYNVGHDLKNRLDLLEAYDMTTEAALVKLMWILGLTKRRDEVRRMFYTPVACDILYTESEGLIEGHK